MKEGDPIGENELYIKTKEKAKMGVVEYIESLSKYSEYYHTFLP